MSYTAIRQGPKRSSAPTGSSTPHPTRAFLAPWWRTWQIFPRAPPPRASAPVTARSAAIRGEGMQAERARRRHYRILQQETKLLALHTNCAPNTTTSAGDRSLHSNSRTDESIAALTIPSTLRHRRGRHDSAPGTHIL